MKDKGESKTGLGSGSGIKVPMGPAFTASDRSQYLGRPRRPRMSGELGSPSQSADSGFSSRLAGVNKGYELDIEMPPMFPDQDEDVEEEEEGAPIIIMPISESRFRLLENRYNRIMRNLGMSHSTLRVFIKEMIAEAKEDEEALRDYGDGFLRYAPDQYGSPTGQDYVGSEEEEEEADELRDRYSVSYKGDMGYRSYQTRPEDVRESALRRIIRREAKEMLSSEEDTKKKDKKKKSLSKDEASGAAAAGGGPATPLGTGPDGGKGRDSGARERSIYASERGYGGGKRSTDWMVYPIKGY